MASASQQPPTYTPPSATEIASRQDEDDALQLLLVQRKLYRVSKRYLTGRMLGMGVIAIAAPIVAFVWPFLAVAVGAIAGGWLILGRKFFIKAEEHYTRQAAAIQEKFDTYVFKMPDIAVRTDVPSLEDIARIAGLDSELRTKAAKEELIAWYPIDPQDTGTTVVAINQRANLYYSASLLKITSRVWVGLIILWVAVLAFLSWKLGLSVTTFLLAVLLPLATPLDEIYDYWKLIRTAAIERASMGQEIEDKLKRNEVNGEELMIWQTRMYDLRIATPQIPEKLYKMLRNGNERIMKAVATQLSDRRRQP